MILFLNMNCIQKIKLDYKINNITKYFFKERNFTLYYDLIKDLIKKEFKLNLNSNITYVKKECIVCYGKTYF